MRKFVQVFWSCSLALMVVGVLNAPEATARTQYMKAFAKKYPKVVEKHGKKKGDSKKATCNFCHGKTKKILNDHASALKKNMGAKNEKDVDKINKALTNSEKETSSKDPKKTFGDLLKAGELPGMLKKDKK